MSRRRSSGFTIDTHSAPFTIFLIVVGTIVAAAAVFLLWSKGFSSLSSSSPSETQEDSPSVTVSTVSDDISNKLGEGTALKFGASPSPSTPVISIIGSPEELSRAKPIVDGKPSELMNAVNRSQATLYYYPVSEDKKTSTDSITRASICRIGAERTPTGIFTLTGIVSNGDKVKGDEDVKKVSEMMKMSSNVKCPVKTNQAATQTSLNAEFFSEHFGLGRDGNGTVAIVVGNEVMTHPESLPKGWMSQVLEGKSLSDIVNR